MKKYALIKLWYNCIPILFSAILYYKYSLIDAWCSLEFYNLLRISYMSQSYFWKNMLILLKVKLITKIININILSIL